MTTLITPQILKGTRDFFPEDMSKRQFVLGKIKEVFARFGYDSIETPAIEYAETILGKYGDEGSKLTYSFTDQGGRRIALRYDQTVPFARFVAANYRELPMPFKRYQLGPVWRADRPAKGRYREFYQCDIDIIGTKSLVAETEVAQVMTSVFTALGFPKFVIRFNSRRLMMSILESFKIPADQQIAVIRILDKLQKIGLEQVKKELWSLLPGRTVDELLPVMTFSGSNESKIQYLRLKNFDTQEIENFLSLAEISSIPKGVLELDLGLARGLDYYTGLIFEAFLPDCDIGSVCGGGRYDNLCALFSKESFSGVGVAFGFDRLLVAAEELGLLKKVALNAQVLVTYFDDECFPLSAKVATELRDNGINTELYFEAASLKKQLKYADKKGIPFVVVCGPEEAAKESVTIKVMKSGKQKMVPFNQVSLYFNGINV